ncbi:MAG: pectinesterase family protein [bacterium]
MKSRSLLLALLALLMAGCPKTATITVSHYDLLVAPDRSGDYSSIQQAVRAAGDGDVVYVKPGVYREDVTIDRPGIRLVGAGPDQVVIDAGQAYAALTLTADGCLVDGFALRNAGSHGLYVKSAGNTVSRCLIIGNGDRGIYFSSFGGNPSARIDHCTVADNEVSGIYVPAGNPETGITNCIVAFNNRAIVSDGDGRGMKVEFNCAYEPDGTAGLVVEGRGNIRRDPRFANHDKGDYRLGKNSPCLGAAVDGSDLGCF